MCNNETERRKKFKPDSALENLLRAYPSINPKDIQYFAPVYYPIADIQIDFEESNFEDFETVQITVLKLIALGHKSPDIISSLMGLTPIYVEKVVKLLLGFGHIDAMLNLTALGKESINQGKKITVVKGIQKFQFDALGLNLIRLDKTVTRSSIIDKEEIAKGILVLDFPDAVSKDAIVNELKSDNFRRIMANKSGILNVNITKINKVSCAGIRYVQAYLLCMKNREPIFFSEREDFSKKRNQKYSWMPFAALTESTKRFLNDDGLTVYPKENADKMLAAVELLLSKDEEEQRRVEESMRSVMDGIAAKEDYGFDKKYIKFDYENGYIEIISKKAFTKLNFKTISLLKKLNDNGYSLSTNKNLRGAIIKLFASDREVLSALDRLDKILRAQGSDSDVENIRLFARKIERSNDISVEDNIIDVINRFEM